MLTLLYGIMVHFIHLVLLIQTKKKNSVFRLYLCTELNRNIYFILIKLTSLPNIYYLYVDIQK